MRMPHDDSGPVWDIYDTSDDDVDPTPERPALTYGVVADAEDFGRPPTQIVMSLSEAKAMLAMDGGICFENWLRLRGLDVDGSPLPTQES